ncbi:MAG: hypothetical protein F6J98_23430 [Moorea sp. SIO4G2]|uniref:hypothetical protein n=1 Tax=Moorena sp. SIO3I8 TaxID=2607833 RepID=UPI0013C09B87|nr:hypothetical protein [Moorena sp. SIO3I8]NEO04807.1 hypothetical protein [Moorena sp. SIO3I8]NEO63229.1 hypothetical protein [Moorena sp. SIO4G2]
MLRFPASVTWVIVLSLALFMRSQVVRPWRSVSGRLAGCSRSVAYWPRLQVVFSIPCSLLPVP